MFCTINHSSFWVHIKKYTMFNSLFIHWPLNMLYEYRFYFPFLAETLLCSMQYIYWISSILYLVQFVTQNIICLLSFINKFIISNKQKLDNIHYTYIFHMVDYIHKYITFIVKFKSLTKTFPDINYLQILLLNIK